MLQQPDKVHMLVCTGQPLQTEAWHTYTHVLALRVSWLNSILQEAKASAVLLAFEQVSEASRSLHSREHAQALKPDIKSHLEGAPEVKPFCALTAAAL